MLYFIIIIQIVLLLTHYLVLSSIVSFLGLTGTTFLISLGVIFFLLSISLVVSNVIAWKYYNVLTRIIFTLSAMWMGLFLYLFFASIISWIIYLIVIILGFTPNTQLISGILYSLAIMISGYGLINASISRITRVTVTLPHLPAAWINRTAVWISDVHLGQIHTAPFANAIAKKIKQLKPDLVFIGGDLFDGVATDYANVADAFSKLEAPLGTFFINGNHEELGQNPNNNKYATALEHSGMTILNNEKRDIDGLQLIGIDYKNTTKADEYAAVLKQLAIDPSKPSIVLKHIPSHLEVTRDAGVSLQISGHTHRGQMYPFRHITHAMFKGFDYGLNYLDSLAVYTSSGVGTWGPPFKIGSKPEIVQFTFK